MCPLSLEYIERSEFFFCFRNNNFYFPVLIPINYSDFFALFNAVLIENWDKEYM